MLRLGLALGSTSVRAALLAQPRLLPHSTVLSATTGIYTPCRTMAAKQKEQSAKKQRYSTKDTIKHKRVKSGLRHKRVSWLDSPRVKTISRKKKPLRHRLHTLNTDKRLTHYVNRLKKDQKEHPTRRPNETWVRTLADQGRISSETATELTDFVLKQSAMKPEDLRPRTYEVLLEMWHRRKNLERATEVFEAMRAHNKLTDYAYSVYCKCLATRGQLDKAKEFMVERQNNASIEGYETLRVMVNYTAADSIEDGVTLFEQWGEIRQRAKKVISSVQKATNQMRLEKKRVAGEQVSGEEPSGEKVSGEASGEEPQPTNIKEPVSMPTKQEIRWAHKVLKFDDEMYSMMIGWSLKHGEPERAQSYYEVRLREQMNKCPPNSDKAFSKRITAYEEAVKKRNDALAKWEEEVKKLKEDSDPRAYNKAVSAGMLKKPYVRMVSYPVRYASKEEYIKERPVVFTSHILRPLIDLEAAGKELEGTWVKRVGDGLKNDEVRSGITMVSQRIYLGDKKRYEVLQNMLKKMGLPYEELMRIPLPKVQHVAPVKQKKVPEIKKWWKVGGKLPQAE